MYLVTPGGGLGAAAVEAAGAPEQKEKFLARFKGEKPVFGAMAMTEPNAGSDTAAIRSSAVLDERTNEWVLNGEKIFVTAGHKSLCESDGIVVVWATIDPTAGRAGMRAFVIPAGTPGVSVTKLVHKLGIRASDTASIVLQDARVPFDHLLGSAEVIKEPTTKGFKGAMATFDATRPLVAATAVGVARAALEELKSLLEKQGVVIRYGIPRQKMDRSQGNLRLAHQDRPVAPHPVRQHGRDARGCVLDFAQFNGQWYGAVYDYYKPNQACKGTGAEEFGRDQIRVPPMDAGWVPRSGDVVGIMASAPARFGYRSVRERLAPGGVVMFNVISGRDSAAYLDAIVQAFASVDVYRPAGTGNLIVFASAQGPLAAEDELRTRARALDQRGGHGFSFQELLAARERRGP